MTSGPRSVFLVKCMTPFSWHDVIRTSFWIKIIIKNMHHRILLG